MLGIVLSNNFLQMFVFWELVGVSSYLLIGFWYDKPSAADACKKAFLTNRLGDFGFILGILLVWGVLGSLHFKTLQDQLTANPQALGTFATAAGLLIFCGAMGKSAQFPLHVWLPDAMEGPTPVSALIHAATMVAAGVYMLARVFFLLDLPGAHALPVIAWIGGFTALLAAVIAVQQNDIKRILAYSTLSQLGYMVMAVGLSGPDAGMFHLATHAFFKALLFLGAGAVIHALHHEQDIWRMGGLAAKMPVTHRTFLLGLLALCGVPPFSGFYSKDQILAVAADHSPLLFALAIAVAVLTTFYMFRLYFVAFLGRERSEAATHAQDAPAVMLWPLVVLAVPTILAGLWGIDAFVGSQFGHAAVEHGGGFWDALFAPFGHSPLAAMAGLGAVLFGFSAARVLYRGAEQDPLPAKCAAIARFARNRFYFDELYTKLIALTHEAVSRLADWLDRWIIGGLGVRGAHGTVEVFGRALRLVQTGNLQTYAFLFVLGVVIVLLFALR
jgi:NADH-quinone oxidoreductase subunit L